MEQLWRLFALGVQHVNDKQVGAEWWTLWRRVSGGLDVAAQLRLLDDFAFNLQISDMNDDESSAGVDESAARPVTGSPGDMLRLGASLERIPAAYKTEIGQWLLDRLQKSLARRRPQDSVGDDTIYLWALGRIGARQPFHGSPHDAVPADVAACYELGVNGYLQKPVEFDQFQECIRVLTAFWLGMNVPPVQAS